MTTHVMFVLSYKIQNLATDIDKGDEKQAIKAAINVATVFEFCTSANPMSYVSRKSVPHN